MANKKIADNNKTEPINLLLDWFRYYEQLLISKLINSIKWGGLDVNGNYDSKKPIDARYLELILISGGSSLFFFDDVLGYVVMKTAQAGKPDIYNVPETSAAYAITGFTKQYTQENSVIIYNNATRSPDRYIINLYADKLARIELVLQMNIKKQMTPYLIATNEDNAFTMKQILNAIETGESAINYNKTSINIDEDLRLFNLNPAFIAKDLHDLKNETIAEFLTFMGINSANTDKKERLIKDEVLANNEDIELQKNSRLIARQTAAEEINKMFGLNITVEYRNGGVENGGIHNGVENNNSEGGGSSTSELSNI